MFKRIVLKLSGEALSDNNGGANFNNELIKSIIRQIAEVKKEGAEVCLIIGGGNFWRGRSANSNMDRNKADQIGMLATVMNAIYVSDIIRQEGMEAIVQTPFQIGAMTELFNKDNADRQLKEGKILIFAGGLGHPFFSTDTVSALRGAELGADVLLFAKNIDGVYDSDPAVNPNAKKYDKIPCADIIKNNLKVIDLSAAAVCLEQKIPVLIFGLDEPNGIIRAVKNENIGTLVTISD